MKKVLYLASALACLAGIPAANAQLVIQPTIVESAPVYEPVYVPGPPVGMVVTYPVHYDHHHHYDWRYWDHREHEVRDYRR